MASWLVFMRKNEPRRRYLGVPLPRPNLKEDFAEQARTFADGLYDKVFGQPAAAGSARPSEGISPRRAPEIADPAEAEAVPG